jgi:Phycobilisome Linker polypeptide
MASTFVNPVVNPAAKLGVSSFDETDPVRLWQEHSDAEAETVIRAVYRQVLGNAHVMESERLTLLESQLKQGELSVREFVRQVAKSTLYRDRFSENCPRYRAIELNFKHLLGRAPVSYAETTHHSQLLDTDGYEADIDSYIDSEEYQQAFGEDTVPYYRGHKTQTGLGTVGFTHLFKLLRGAAASDKNLVSGERSRLLRSILTDTPSQIVPPTAISPNWRPIVDVNQLVARVLGLKSQPIIPAIPLPANTGDLSRQRRYQGYQAFADAPVELRPGSSDGDLDIVIRAVYRQVLGNAHVMESERLNVPESQLKRGELSVREFVRQVAKSELYRSRFFDNCYRYRSIELNFKHLLGRAPDRFDETRYHSSVLDQYGFEADIDTYLDSDEYQTAFGENIVPFYRGYTTNPGQSMLEFTNMLQLLRSASSSDKDLKGGNRPQVQRALILNSPFGKTQVSDIDKLLAEVLRPKFQFATVTTSTPAGFGTVQPFEQEVREQERQIASLQQELATLRPFASIGSTVTRSGQFGSAAIAEKYPALQQRSQTQTEQIESLQAQIAEARALASVGEYRLNKWRSRTFSS